MYAFNFQIICSRRLPKNAKNIVIISNKVILQGVVSLDLVRKDVGSWWFCRLRIVILAAGLSSGHPSPPRPVTVRAGDLSGAVCKQGRSMLLAQLHRWLVKSFNTLPRTSRKQLLGWHNGLREDFVFTFQREKVYVSRETEYFKGIRSWTSFCW